MMTITRINKNPGPGSARYTFQWKYVLSAEKLPALNVGCANDPVQFGEYAVHFDYDDWSKLYGPRGEKFVQGDAHRLPFKDQSFFLTICGDVLEHAVDPAQMFAECCRVAKRWAVFTIFEEWRIGDGHGQFIAEGTAHRDAEARKHGHADARAHFVAAHPEWQEREGVSHHPHINQFHDDYIFWLVKQAVQSGMRVREYVRADENVQDGHQWCNWLICLERLNARQTSP